MSNLYRVSTKDASYQISIHLAKRFSFFSLADLKKSSTLKPLCQMNRDLVGSIWQVLYKDWSFRPDTLTNMATTGNSCFLAKRFQRRFF
jgi:hypothetical protein